MPTWFLAFIVAPFCLLIVLPTLFEGPEDYQ